MHDPHAEREAAKYENPIASRELILETISQADKALTAKQIADLIKLDPDNFEALSRRLFAMQRDGQLVKNRRSAYLIPDRSELLKGKVIAHRDGFGFIQLSEGGNDLYVQQREMRKVFDGDEVLVAITHTKKNGQAEAEIVAVTQHNTHSLVGKLLIDGDRARVIPENPKISHTIFIEQDFTINAEHEQLVVVEITQQPDAHRAPKGIIKEVLGNLLDPGMEIEIAVRNFNIPAIWPESVLAQAEALGDEPCEADKKDRFDLRHLALVTIDGEDARDFDDAVYCEKTASGGWRLWVAIADVSHYVGINSPFDEEAILRATSVYFPENVIPMLPEKLSNGLCSLKPKVDRLCMVCEMTISADGLLEGYEFYEAVMHSHARLTYNEVGRIVAEKGDDSSIARKENQALTPQLDELYNLYQALYKQRLLRGAINFETQETRFIFNAQRKIEEIVPVVRNDAHKLIEECMLCANVATASFLNKYKIPALFRVHEGPTEKKLTNLREFIGERGLTLPGGDKPTPSDYHALFQQIEGREDASIIQTMMLRSMNQAVYEPENKGHFGLAYEAYAHFTSPIRRYPDLLVHRAIRSIIRSKAKNTNVKRVETQSLLKASEIYPYDMPALVALGEQCSMAERRADDATRDVSSWLKCEYLQEHIGSQFEGKIVAVANFGFFVELNDLFAEGLVHVSQLGNDFFQFDAAKQRLIGDNTRQVFNLGDKVTVIISKVELEERKVHLQLAGSSPSKNLTSETKTPAKGKKPRSKKPAAKKKPRRKSASKTATSKPKKS